MPNDAEFPDWDMSNSTESLKRVYEWAIQKAQSNIEWYQRKIKSKRFCSQVFRGLSIFFAAVGTLFPLIDATKISGDENLGQWGYVLFALAAAFLGFDRYFGVSTGWMRYIVTQMSLERTLKAFQYDWITLIAQQQESQLTQDETLPLLEKLKDFSLQVDTLVKQETDLWVSEFRSNLAALEKAAKTEIEARRPGIIKVKVTNARDFADGVAIRLNDNPVKWLIGVTEDVLDSIPPGQHVVTAIGKEDDKEVKESKVVEVQPNATASVELTLPSP